MAGDWIKMRHDLADDPAVVLIAAETGLDEYAVVGRLQKLWSWADRHTCDGYALSVTLAWINRFIACAGFAEAMFRAGWLAGVDGSIHFPHFDRHNGKPAKQRAQSGQRVAQLRDAQRKSHAHNATEVTKVLRPQRNKSATREEKSIYPPLPPLGGRETGKTISPAEQITHTERAAPDRTADGQGAGHDLGSAAQAPPIERAARGQGGRRAGQDLDALDAQRFARFWAAYPRKVSKGQAEKAFAKLKPSEQQVAEMVSAIERAKTSAQWQRDGGQYIPHPATWLNAKGWEDEHGGALSDAHRVFWETGL